MSESFSLATEPEGVVASLLERFWEAEPEHQDYLLRRPHGYTCHFPRPAWVLPRRSDVAARPSSQLT